MSDLPYANKSLGQHWLNDELALGAICDSADLKPTDTVLEIGPGHGSLTELLVKGAKQVVAVELDKILANNLKNHVPAANLTVVEGDILSFDLTSLPKDYKIVANIPYYLTSNLIRVVSESQSPPLKAVLLVQKEVAERLAAKPGNLSILGVTAQFYWDISLGVEVSAEMFTPPPKVDSQIVILSRPVQSKLPGVDSKRFFQIVKAGFGQKRKTLLNSLSAGLQISREQTEELCKTANIDSSRRAQTLTLKEWHQLYIVHNA